MNVIDDDAEQGGKLTQETLADAMGDGGQSVHSDLTSCMLALSRHSRGLSRFQVAPASPL
jgi:hypothetical protein